MWSNPRERAAVNCGEMDQGDVKEETVVGNVWRKVKQPWKQDHTAESRVVGGAIPIAPLSPQASIGN